MADQKLIEICKGNFDDLIQVVGAMKEELPHRILEAAIKIISTFNLGGKLLICGNGGSAADSQHLAAEFVSSFSKSISRRSLPAIALTTDSSVLTAFSNDFGFTGIFAQQVEALGKPVDTLVVLSTSGNSANVLSVVEKAKSIGMTTIAFTGESGKLNELSDITIRVPSSDTQRIQESHQLCYHSLVEIVELTMFGELK